VTSSFKSFDMSMSSAFFFLSISVQLTTQVIEVTIRQNEIMSSAKTLTVSHNKI